MQFHAVLKKILENKNIPHKPKQQQKNHLKDSKH